MSAGGHHDAVVFPAAADWEAWLEEHGDTSDGLWLRIAKKGSGHDSVTHAQALEIALCFGWIDGQRRALDATHFAQRFTPRRARSSWSKINRDKAMALIDAGRMRPPGLREVEAAQADGRWDAAYDGQRTMQVPDDLQALLDAEPAARAFFESLDSQNRYSILYRLQTAKRPETRARRLATFMEMLREGRRIYER